jgi:hypothetical protein
MLAAAERFEEVALELATAIGLPGQIAERDTVTIQMLLDAGSEDGVGRRALRGSSPNGRLATYRNCAQDSFGLLGEAKGSGTATEIAQLAAHPRGWRVQRTPPHRPAQCRKPFAGNSASPQF